MGFQTMRAGIRPSRAGDGRGRHGTLFRPGYSHGRGGGRAVRNGRSRRGKDECLAGTLINHTASLAFYTLMRIKYARAGYRCVYRTSRIKWWWMYCGADAWGANRGRKRAAETVARRLPNSTEIQHPSWLSSSFDRRTRAVFPNTVRFRSLH